MIAIPGEHFVIHGIQTIVRTCLNLVRLRIRVQIQDIWIKFFCDKKIHKLVLFPYRQGYKINNLQNHKEFTVVER